MDQQHSITSHRPPTIKPTADGQLPVSVIRKEEEASYLRDEILKQVGWQQPLLLAIFFGGSTFLSLGLQPGVSGLTAMVFPVAALALKLSAYDLRTGQINFHLRFVLRSPWEIVRRAIFNSSPVSELEQQVLVEQGITISDEMLKAAKKLKPPIAEMHSTANRLAFLTFESAALGIGVLRTYPAVFHFDPPAIFIWI